MIISKLNEIKNLPELIAIAIAVNFIIQLSYKFGYLSNFGFWTISLFNPIEIMLGNIEILLIYILIFSYILSEDYLLEILFGIATVTIIPFISVWLYTGNFELPSFSLFGIAIGLIGLFLKKVSASTKLELFTFIVLLVVSPFLFGVIKGTRLEINDLSKIEITENNKKENWYILDKFSDNFLTINKDKTNIKIVKLEKTNFISINK